MKRSKWALSPAILITAGFGVAGCQISDHALKAYETAPIEESIVESASGEELDVLPEDIQVQFRPGQKVSFSDEGVSNPAQFGPVSGRNDLLLRRHYSIVRPQCDGFVARRPAIMLDAPDGFQHVRISADGEAQVLFVEMPGRDYRCEVIPSRSGNLTIDGRNWPSGTYRIFVGGPTRLETVNYTLTVEDMTQPATVAWLQGTLPTIDVDGAMSVPRFARQSFDDPQRQARDVAHGDTSCLSGPGPLQYPLYPDVQIDVRQSMSVIIGARSDVDGHITLVGPISEDQRNIPTQCLKTSTEEVTLMPGSYYVRYGVLEDAQPRFVDVFVHSSSTRVDPLTHGDGEVPAGLDVEGRRLPTYYPFLTTQSLVASDLLRHQLYLGASPRLFVAAKEDLNPSSPASVYNGLASDNGASSTDESHLGRFQHLPKKGEALLLLNDENLVLAADGSMFKVDPSHLVPIEQAEPAVMPTDARNGELPMERALQLAGSEDLNRLAMHRESRDRYTECVADTFARVQDRVDRLMMDPEANQAQVERINMDTQNRAERTCGLAQLKEDEKILQQELEQSRTARRQQQLDLVRSTVLPKLGSQ